LQLAQLRNLLIGERRRLFVVCLDELTALYVALVTLTRVTVLLAFDLLELAVLIGLGKARSMRALVCGLMLPCFDLGRELVNEGRWRRASF